MAHLQGIAAMVGAKKNRAQIVALLTQQGKVNIIQQTKKRFIKLIAHGQSAIQIKSSLMQEEVRQNAKH